jgi:2-dehydro-3-deoxygluconokinase
MFPGTMEVSFAGAEANVAASVALFGGSASFVTVLPDNPVGESCVGFLKNVGIDTSRIIMIPDGRIGTYYIEAGANQRAGAVVYDRENSAIAEYPPDQYDWERLLMDADWFHTTGITPALSQSTATAAIEAVKAAKRLGITVSCDLNFRGKLWKWGNGKKGRELARETMSGLLPYADVLIGNESDADDVLGIRAGTSRVDRGELDVERYREVAEQIVALFPNISRVAITLRESVSASHNRWGAMLYNATDQTAIFEPTDASGTYAPHDIRTIVDRVGAGDSFGGALIFALRSPEHSADLSKALRWAVAASTLCHSIDGDFNFVTRNEVEALAMGDASGRVRR